MIMLVGVVVMAAYQNQVKRTDLVYADSLEKTALVVDGEPLDLRELAFYIAYQEKYVQQEAVVYDSEKPEKYWNAYTNHHFVRSVAEDAVKEMAVHDEIFYQMAVAEKLELDETEKNYLENEQADFFMDLSKEQLDRLGVTEDDLADTMKKIALANKYQSILSQVEGVEYETYDYTGGLYELLLAEHTVEEKENVWNRISVGNITVNYK